MDPPEGTASDPEAYRYLALYRIDAWNYAGTKNTPAVVESNYVVICSAC